MNFWIEVTSGMRWSRLLKEGVALEAPNITRHQHFFAGIKSGDFVLHYLTTSLTREKEKRSSVVGASKIDSDPSLVGKKIEARCSGTIEFPKPVLYSELQRINTKSEEFDKLVRVSMQRYLTRISESDFESVIGVHPANMKQFSKSPLARWLQPRLKKSRLGEKSSNQLNWSFL